MSKPGFSRRSFLLGAGALAGFAASSRILGRRVVRKAHAADGDPTPALFLLYLRGGYNALFCSADSFLQRGSFGVTANNIQRIGQSDVYVDRNSLGTMPASALQRMASVGVRHGYSGHPAAQQSLFMRDNRSYPLLLAQAVGSQAAIQCATVGPPPPGDHRAIGGVSMQRVNDLATTIAALGGTTSNRAPDREIAAGGIAAADAMSQTTLAAHPGSTASLSEGYPAAVGLLTQDTVALDYAEMAGAYGIPANGNGTIRTSVGNDMRMRLMGAELMIRAGASVVTTMSTGWDSHGDRDGSEVRNKMQGTNINAALRTFLARTLAMPDRNVVTAIIGDFSRSLPGSDHQPNLTATVFGNRVKLGTTGRVDRDVRLPNGTPGIEGMWAMLSAALGTAGNPFGNNPHGSLIL